MKYEVNEEIHRLCFRKDHLRRLTKSGRITCRNTFGRWRKDRDIPLEELVLIEQFKGGVPEDPVVWLKEKLTSLQEAAEMADNYTTARKAEGRELPHAPPKGIHSLESKSTVDSSGKTR